MPVEHYENFPVASFLLPARLREPVEAIYAFARSADDIADEGNALARVRLERLDAYRRHLRAAVRKRPIDDPELAPMFERLGRNIRHHQLPVPLLGDAGAWLLACLLVAGGASYRGLRRALAG